MMVNTAGVDQAKIHAGAFVRLADRWIYVFMAGLFVVTALAGFIPTSIRLLDAVEAGRRPPPPLVLHFHAALMGTWLLLFLAQAMLMRQGAARNTKDSGSSLSSLRQLWWWP